MSALAFPTSLSRKLGNFVFQIPTTLQPGDILSYNDAMLYNTARSQNIVQAFGDRFRKIMEERKGREGEVETAKLVETELLKFAAAYSYSPMLSNLPPVEREMIEIADAELSALAKKQGKNFEEVPRGKREELRDSYIVRNSARIRSEAERRVSALDGIDASGIDFSEL